MRSRGEGSLNAGDELKAGILGMGGKLLRFRITAGGTLTVAPLQAGGAGGGSVLKGKNAGPWQLGVSYAAPVSIVTTPTKSKPFQFTVASGGTPKFSLKLEGNSQQDVDDWVMALRRFATR